MYWECNNRKMARMGYFVLLVSAGWVVSLVRSGDAVSPASAAAGAESPAGDAPLSKFQEACAKCHGNRGEGNFELKTPSIAGLPDWYVTLQIEKFQKGLRGAHPADTHGVQMHGIAGTLDEEAVTEVAETIQSLERIPTRNTLGGDSEKGAEIYQEVCIECHRFNARGEKVFRSAPLTGLQDWYILSQLKKFQAGIRGGAEEDPDGAKMHRVTSSFTETDFRNVAAYIADLAERYGTGEEHRSRRYR